MLKNTQHLKHVVASLAVIVAVGLFFLTLHAVPVRASVPAVSSAPAMVVAPTLPPMIPAPTETAPPPAKLSSLATYTLEIMNGWTHAVPQVPTADYVSVATDIAEVAKTPEDAVLLAAIGYWEGSRYAEYVDTHACNVWMAEAKTHGRTVADPKSGILTRIANKGALPREAQKLLAYGDCDGGEAYSLFQIHPVADRAAPVHADCALETITASRKNAAKCALELAQQSIRYTGDLSSYTGEWGAATHPASDKRLAFAKRALIKHPFQPHQDGVE